MTKTNTKFQGKLKIHNKTIHYSWIIVFISFMALVISAGIRATPSVLIVPFEHYFGWNRAAISVALAISLLLYGLCGPFAAALMELYGIRRIMTVALFLLSIGTCLSSWMNKAWQMNLLWGFVIGIGTGFLSPVLGTVIARRWFIKHRGLVIGIFSAGGATGQLIFMPLFSKLLEIYNWQIIVRLISLLALFIMLLVAIIIRNKPSDIGVLPYGALDADIVNSVIKHNPVLLVFKGLKTAIYSKDFWLLSGSFFVCGATTSGLIGSHFIPACMDDGMNEIVAATMLSMAGIFNIVGTTISGWLSDKLDNRWLLFWYYALRGFSLIFLPFGLKSNFQSLLIFIIFYGLDWVATVPPTVNIINNLFGKQGGIVFGWIMAIHQVGSAIAAFSAGAVHTMLGDYNVAFISGGIFCLIASGLVMKIHKETPVNIIT